MSAFAHRDFTAHRACIYLSAPRFHRRFRPFMPLAFLSLASSYACSLGRRFKSLNSAHAEPAAALHTTARAAAVLFACAALAVAAPAEARKKAQQPAVNVTTVLPPAVMAGLQRAHVPLSSISVVVEKVGDRTPVLALNAGKPMMPASTMKVVITYSGLSLLGPDYRWKTTA